MAFRIILTAGGQNSYNHCLDYFWNALEDQRLAKKWVREVENALRILETNAEDYAIYDDPALAGKNLRRIRLKKYSYKIFYEIRGDNVYVIAILHDKQDAGKWLN